MLTQTHLIWNILHPINIKHVELMLHEVSSTVEAVWNEGMDAN